MICSFSLYQIFVPNGKDVYGTASAIVLTGGPTDQGCTSISMKRFSQVFYITKIHKRALDQPSHRCMQQKENVNTSACISRYLENRLGCNTMILGSQYSQNNHCTTRSQLMALANISKKLEEADADDIYKMTGCLSSCEKDQYSLSAEPLKQDYASVWMGDTPCELHLQFRMRYSSYEEKEQYIIYDFNSFIADVGGFMGLLLGCSLLSIYSATEAFLRQLLGRN